MLVGAGVTVIITNVGCTLVGAHVGFGGAVMLPLPQPIMNKTVAASESVVSIPRFLTEVLLDNGYHVGEGSDFVDRNMYDVISRQSELWGWDSSGSSHH